MAKEKEKRKPEDISSDGAVCEMLKSLDPELSTVFDRSESMKACPIGAGKSGICCKNCSMGPCRVTEGKTGLCGATMGTIAARNQIVPDPVRMENREKRMVSHLKNSSSNTSCLRPET